MPKRRRVLVCNRDSSTTRDWPASLARELGQRGVLEGVMTHVIFDADKEYLPTFRFRDAADTPELIGKRLGGATVYIASQDSSTHSRQTLSWHNLQIAYTARYNGADNVVLVQPNLWYAAQERGTKDPGHPRMQTDTARAKFDGQAPTLRMAAEMYRTAGIDRIITVHTHSPADVERIFGEVYGRPGVVFDLDVSRIVGAFIGKRNMDGLVEIVNDGENIVFVAPDAGAKEFVEKVLAASGLPNASAIYNMKDRSGQRNVRVEFGDTSPNYTGYNNKILVLCDDMIRTGATMVGNIEKLYEGLEKPARTVIYATHSNLTEARRVLASDKIHDIIVTNSVPTVGMRCGQLGEKLTVLQIGGYVADAIPRCLETGVPPSKAYTSSFLASNFPRLVKVHNPPMHYKFWK
jgi:ribose-phosphate pyrophosphokinase